MVKISILMENSGSGHRGLIAEHGLAIYIEDDGHSILFDTGSTDAFLMNARLMRIDISQTEIVVMSHCHYDHTGGFPSFMEQWHAKNPLLITGKDFLIDRFEQNSFAHTYLGVSFSSEDLEAHGIVHEEIVGARRLSPHCHAVSGFTRSNNFERVPAKFEKYVGARFSHDDFSEECCIVVEAPEGLHVLVGCAHFGILNIVSRISALFARPVVGVYGGIHLFNSNRDEIHTVLDGLDELGVARYGLCHCSGALVQECLQTAPTRRESANLSVGNVLFF